ncbi:MAG: hypothetical protein ACPG4L_04160 [Candidatus Puniceispirillaceae bacterium]
MQIYCLAKSLSLIGNGHCLPPRLAECYLALKLARQEKWRNL